MRGNCRSHRSMLLVVVTAADELILILLIIHLKAPTCVCGRARAVNRGIVCACSVWCGRVSGSRAGVHGQWVSGQSPSMTNATLGQSEKLSAL